MAPRRVEAAVAAVIFVVSAIWGGVFHAQYIKAGHHPFFYQSYFEPAVMVACGKGFLVSKVPPPPLRAFLMEQTDRLSCDVSETAGAIEVTLYIDDGNPDAILGDFRNEVLDQVLRERIRTDATARTAADRARFPSPINGS